ncbi:MAG TPA: GrpB family protein [Bryobacteraceae bacterium]|nr:GrpB family protein [Bryobacteraceae bacterium]
MSQDRNQPRALSERYLRASTLGDLTPLAARIVLVEYDAQWPQRFQQEAQLIRTALGQHALRIEHVGSTSIPGLTAKPIVDIVLVVADSRDEAGYAPALEKAGYRLRIREPGWHEHRMFKGGNDEVNLHAFSTGCPEVDRMLDFRDWLRGNEEDRELYARTKRRLAQEDWKYTQNYADAKTEVIEQILSKASRTARSPTIQAQLGK